MPEKSDPLRRKIIRRDQYGRPYLDRARDDEDGSGSSVLDHLRDGERLHVPMLLRDSADAWREDMHRHLTTTHGTTDAPPVINTTILPMVVDASGGTEGLNRPGARYLAAGHRTADHARLATLAAMRDEAYKAYDEEAQNAWRGNAPTCAAPTLDSAEQAYLDYDREMSEAWRGGR